MQKNIAHNTKSSLYTIAILFMCSLFASLGNYLYYPLTASLLTKEDFWVFMSLLALSNIVGFSSSGFSIYINKLVSENIHAPQYIQTIYNYYFQRVFILSLGLFGIFCIFSIPISSYLKISSPLLVVFSSLWLIAMSLLLVTEWIGKWKQLFWFLWVNYIFNAYIKLLIWWILILLWFNIYWAVSWLILWSFLSFIFCVWILDKNYHITLQKKFLKVWEIHTPHEQNKNYIYFIIMSIYVWLIMNVDILLARNIFSESVSSLYALISIVGKIILFLLLAIETVYYSKILSETWKWMKKKLLFQAWLSMGTIIGWALIVCVLFWRYFISLLQFDTSTIQVLLWNILFYGMCIAISFILKFIIQVKKELIFPICWINICVLVFVSYFFWKESLVDFSYSLALGNSLWLIICGSVFYMYKKDIYETV